MPTLQQVRSVILLQTIYLQVQCSLFWLFFFSFLGNIKKFILQFPFCIDHQQLDNVFYQRSIIGMVQKPLLVSVYRRLGDFEPCYFLTNIQFHTNVTPYDGVRFKIARHSIKSLIWCAAITCMVFSLMTGLIICQSSACHTIKTNFIKPQIILNPRIC